MDHMESFGCCLEQALHKIDAIEDKYHLYNTTKECNVYLDPPLNGTDFISAVVYFYMHEMENATVSLVSFDYLIGKKKSAESD